MDIFKMILFRWLPRHETTTKEGLMCPQKELSRILLSAAIREQPSDIDRKVFSISEC